MTNHIPGWCAAGTWWAQLLAHRPATISEMLVTSAAVTEATGCNLQLPVGGRREAAGSGWICRFRQSPCPVTH